MREIALFTGMRSYVGKIRTLRNEIRTRRLLASLPPGVQRDIGWPERRDLRPGRDSR